MRVAPAPDLSHAELLAILSLASDLGVGLPAEHGLRACYIGLRVAEQAGLDRREQADVCQTQLLKDAGCTSWSTQLATFIRGDEIAARREMLFERELGAPRDVLGWAAKYVAANSAVPLRASRLADFMVHGRDFMLEGFLNAGEAARRIAQRLGAPPKVLQALPSLFEQWNGAGMPLGLRGDSIPLLSRIVFMSSYVEVAHHSGGRDAAVRLARERSGSAFDPAMVQAFYVLARDDDFWIPLENRTVWPVVKTQLGSQTSGDLDELARCCADFVDMKSPWLAGHSRRVADVAERMAGRLGLADTARREVALAGLVHDLGLVAVPSFILNKPDEKLTVDDRRALTAHSTTVRDLLGRTAALRSVAEIAALHHSGPGHHGSIGTAAPIVAVANEFDELTHAGPGRQALTPEQAVRSIHARQGSAEVRDAIAEEVGSSWRATKPGWPGGLTDREVDVLRCLAAGLSRREIAHRLVVSESTVRTHLEHMYDKLGVSTRVGAVLFALEHGLTA